MHDEGADGFADGPRPWETWDESGAQAGKHVWEGKARRIYKNTPVRRSFGDRVISGLAMIALATMAVGIAGVYLTEEQPQTVAWTAIQPTPIPLQREAVDTQRLPARKLRPAPVIAEIDSLPPPAAGIEAVAMDRPAAGTPASKMPPLPAANIEAADTATPGVDTTAAAMPADNPAWDTAAEDPDIEIVKAPSALLLTSSASDFPDDSYEAPGMEMDAELAMAIATAPAAASSGMEAAPVAATGMTTAEAGAAVSTPESTGADSDTRKAPPARDLINRGSTSHTEADSVAPETGTATTGLASAPAMETMAESAAGTAAVQPATALPDTATVNDSGSEAIVATAAATTMENSPPAATGPATTTADAAAERDMQAQDIPPSTGEESPASENAVVALAAPEPVAAAPSPSATAAAAPAGDWVVNLASYNHEAMARRKLGEFQAKGVTAEIESAVINARTMYRIRVGGFENSRAARASIASLEKTLGLKGVWISKR